MKDFLSPEFLTSGIDPRKLSAFVTANVSKWNREDWERMLEELAPLVAATDSLTEVTKTGQPFMADAFWSFFKAVTDLHGPNAVRPDHLINLLIRQEMEELSEWAQLRRYTQGDDVASAMACVTIEPDVETLFDRQQKRQEELDELLKQMQAFAESQAQLHDLDAMVEQMMADDPENPELEGLQAEAEAGAAALGEMGEALQAAGQAICEAMGGDKIDIRLSMKDALGKALDEARSMAMSGDAWGLEPGEIKRMDANERMALAKKINGNPKLKRIAEIFGKSKPVLFLEQERKVEYARTEVHSLTEGDDIEHLLPEEILRLADPDLELEFLADFAEGRLQQYHLEGEEKVAKGAIIWCEDGSGSMAGEKELWAKAIGLCLLHLARKQNRRFYAIHFGSPGEYKVFDFAKPSDFVPAKIFAFAELFFDGGTDFETPLNVAVQHLQEEYRTTTRVEGDIVFCTDGLCQVKPRWLDWFLEEQSRLKFLTYGIIIGGRRDAEPLRSICDGRVATPRDMLGGGDVREVFRAL